jgi:hypothetical protein
MLLNTTRRYNAHEESHTIWLKTTLFRYSFPFIVRKAGLLVVGSPCLIARAARALGPRAGRLEGSRVCVSRVAAEAAPPARTAAISRLTWCQKTHHDTFTLTRISLTPINQNP